MCFILIVDTRAFANLLLQIQLRAKQLRWEFNWSQELKEAYQNLVFSVDD